MSEDIIFDYDFELVSIQLNIAEIRLEFGALPKSLAVDFNISFEVTGPHTNDSVETIVPWDRLGDLRTIWPLIGVRMDKLIMDGESCRLIFSNGTILRSKRKTFRRSQTSGALTRSPERSF
jgi:hypothetical protein